MTVGELIERLGGELIRGDSEIDVFWVGSADGADQSVLTFGDTAAGAELAVRRGAGAAVVPEGYVPTAWNGWTAVIAAKQPRLWFAQAAKQLEDPLVVSGIHATAVVAASAKLGDEVSIGPGAVIGEEVTIGDCTRVEAGVVLGERVQIGQHCRIHPRAVIYPFAKIGNRVVVHAGAVLGADGFGYVRDKETGAYTQFPQQGTLVIEDDVGDWSEHYDRSWGTHGDADSAGDEDRQSRAYWA